MPGTLAILPSDPREGAEVDLGIQQVCRPQTTCVCIEARGEEDGLLSAVKLGDGVLEGLVKVLGAANEAHARHAETVRFQRPLCGLYQPWVVRQAKAANRRCGLCARRVKGSWLE